MLSKRQRKRRGARWLPSGVRSVGSLLRVGAPLLAAAIAATGVAAAPLCRDVPVQGQPPCPPGSRAVCATRVLCLDSKFPALPSRPCAQWICEVVAPPGKGSAQVRWLIPNSELVGSRIEHTAAMTGLENL